MGSLLTLLCLDPEVRPADIGTNYLFAAQSAVVRQVDVEPCEGSCLALGAEVLRGWFGIGPLWLGLQRFAEEAVVCDEVHRLPTPDLQTFESRLDSL